MSSPNGSEEKVAYIQDEDEAPQNYYKMLGVDTTATTQQITAAYRRVAMKLHPDKCKTSGNTMSEEEAGLLFTKLSQAYSVLCDEATRGMYDLDMGFLKDTDGQRSRIQQLKKKKAEQAVALMSETVAAIRKEERSKDGLTILLAQYGQVDALNLQDESAAGTFIDVTVPLQCMVSQSTLIIHRGGSKAWLEGFYEPPESAGGAEACNELLVIYKFLGQVHEVIVGDTEELYIPRKEHLTAAKQNAKLRKMYKQELRRRKKTKRRRRMVLYTGVALAAGALAYKAKLLPKVGNYVPSGVKNAVSGAIKSLAQAAVGDKENTPSMNSQAAGGGAYSGFSSFASVGKNAIALY